MHVSAGSFLFGHETGHSIARPIACGNRVPPQRTVLRETPRTASILHKQKEPHPAGCSSQKREEN